MPRLMHAPSTTPVTVKELSRLAGPIVVSRLGVMAMGLTDAIVVGHHSAQELGYHSLGWAPTATVLVGGIGLLAGIQVLTSRHIGAGQPERTGAVLRRGLSYALMIGLLATAVLALLGPPAMRMIGLAPDVAANASAVLLVFSLSLTPYLMADAIWFWLEAQGKPAVPMTAMWVANVLNLLLALWLVPGNSPFPVEGAMAAAWVTLSARTALLIMLVVYVWRWPKARALGLFQRSPPEPAAAREQRRIGYASGISYAVEAGGFSALNFVAAQVSVLAVAGWAVVLNVAGVVFMIPLGIGAATAVLVARCAGAGDMEGIRRAFRLGQGMSFLVLLLLSLLLWWQAPLVIRAYTSDPALFGPATAALLLACLFFVSDGAQVVAGNALRARGDIWWPTWVQGFSYILLMLPLAWWLAVAKGNGIMGIVQAVIIASIFSAAFLVGRFLWLKDRTMSRTI